LENSSKEEILCQGFDEWRFIGSNKGDRGLGEREEKRKGNGEERKLILPPVRSWVLFDGDQGRHHFIRSRDHLGIGLKSPLSDHHLDEFRG